MKSLSLVLIVLGLMAGRNENDVELGKYQDPTQQSLIQALSSEIDTIYVGTVSGDSATVLDDMSTFEAHVLRGSSVATISNYGFMYDGTEGDQDYLTFDLTTNGKVSIVAMEIDQDGNDLILNTSDD